MARSPEPWKRKGRPGWFAWVNDRQVRLTGPDGTRKEANAALAELLKAEEQGKSP